MTTVTIASTTLASLVPAAAGPLELLARATGPVAVTVWVLLAAAVASWSLIAVGWRWVARAAAAQASFELRMRGHLGDPTEVSRLAAAAPSAPAALAITALTPLQVRGAVLEAAAELELTAQAQQLGRGLAVLATVGSVAPFVGLFGTVYGILDAFLRIGASGSASLAVVAPSIGEALVVTAVGLFAAIPAVVGYNLIVRELDALSERSRGLVMLWVRARECAVESGGRGVDVARFGASISFLPGARGRAGAPEGDGGDGRSN